MLSSRAIVLCTILATLVSVSMAACPNKCSGHGSCGASDKCSCHIDWFGGDCSLRRCPYTRAWVDTAEQNNEAHYYEECANRGTCDRSTGECICDAGFTGKGCRRMACPNSCSGHGTCEFIEEMASDTSDKRIAGVSGRTYSAWDTEKIMGCKCDGGYEGHDCSKKVCPKGDDPLTGTTDQYEMKQYIMVAGTTSNFFLTYYDPYGNTWTTDEIAVESTLTDDTQKATVCSNIQTALRRLPNHALDSITVASDLTTIYTYTRTTGADVYTNGGGSAADSTIADDAQWRCIVTFPSTPGTTGLQHLFGCTAGAHNTAGMQPLVSGSTSQTCTVAENAASGTTTRKLTEIAECSNRGICDSTTGKCQCFAGHKGLACESQEALV